MFTSADFTQRYATTLKINLDFLSGVYRSRGQEKLALLPTPTPTLPPPSPVKLAPKPVKKVVRIKTTPTPTPGEKKYLYYGSTEPTDLGELTAYRSTKIRFNVEWPRSLRAFQKNPLLGTGYSSLTLATDNDYLRALGETGILGFVALGLIFLEIFRRTFTFIFQKPGSLEKAFVIGVMGAILGFLVNAFFIDVFEASKVAFIFWMLVGMMVATVRLMSVSNENK